MNLEILISKTPLFESLSAESKKALADICLEKKLKKKQVLFHEGQQGYSLYLLSEGNIQLYKTTVEGKEVVIRIMKPGELFAEAILFEEAKYPVSAIALKDSKAYMIPKHQFLCLLEEQRFRTEFIASLMHKLRYLADQIRYLTSADVEERLLMFLRDQFGKKEFIVTSLSKKAVAATIGITPETLSRLLQRLKIENKMEWQGKKITIVHDYWKRLEKKLVQNLLV